ncbi:hypothetical protein PUNSTDRAFT_121281 [Punctularia strigosozonata HHB-11173 SS5]|uniref:uncharacterized protein n=1 Tax=Punctularia strigosozonata (strain HHB-11173) TaxID=741275 RepID=UPI0004417583|nr:uncharacterized protein PUNSTDRAFT_121281 [Punctularia strigosozonata HHB-11173 SS5]EIN07054.1 hypothetical protein PUNSTDRAFT_121281 [Punctularia strigosozonata HHB-11173 SS5]
MPLLELNLELLDHIFGLLSRRSLCDLGSTCHTARWLVLPALLRDVTLVSDHQARQFCEFVLAGRSARAALIRSFTIEDPAFLTLHLNDVGFPTPCGVIDCAPKLAVVLENACNITSLRLGKLDMLILQEPRIQTALQACRTLLDIAFSDVGPRAMRAMKNMCGVRRARLAVTGCSDIPALLQPFRSSLEDVLIASPGTEFISIAPNTTWPNVHTLRVPHTALSRPQIVCAFPRLRHLGVGVYQRLYGPKDVPDDVNWAHLESAEGDAIALRSLPLTCPVRRISALVYETEESRAALLDVLQATRPAVLCCTVVPSMSEEFFVQISRRSPGIRALELSLSVFAVGSDEEFVTLLAQLATSLAHLRIHYLCLARELGLDPPALTSEFKETVARSVQSLKYLEERHSAEGTFWEVVRGTTGNEVTLREMQPADGRRIRSQWFQH